MVEVLRQEINVKRRRVGHHHVQESFSGADAVDVVHKFLHERKDHIRTAHENSGRDKAVKVGLFFNRI